MAEIINLRRVRKAKARDLKQKAAADNRIRFGRGKQERSLAKAEEERAVRALDQHRRESDD